MRAENGKGTDIEVADRPLPFRLRGVLAGNASPMTGPGTMTHILGEGVVTVIDPGPDDPAHLQAILAALATAERVEAILVTHPHLDHSALAPALAQATGAPVYGFGPAGSGRNPQMQALVAAGFTGGGEGVDHTFTPGRLLRDGERLHLACGEIEALHTPGHMSEHLAFGLDGVLFCGDLVMGWAPSLVSPPDGDMGDYLVSLAQLAARDWLCLLPTHGAPIPDASARLAELTAHRRAREAQILSTLTQAPADLSEITATVYAGLDAALIPAARRNALAHLLDLQKRQQIKAKGQSPEQAIFELSAPPEKNVANP